MKHFIISFVSLIFVTFAFADDHIQTLFNGKDLTGWQDRNGTLQNGKLSMEHFRKKNLVIYGVSRDLVISNCLSNSKQLVIVASF